MKKQLLLALCVVFCLSFLNSNAQVSSTPFVSALDTFTTISGTTIDSYMNDDQYYSHIPIGFNFDFSGTTHTEMIVSCNGYIQLDSTPTTMFSNILSGQFNHRISALGADLKNFNASANIQYVTLGSAPNRVCVIQWLHYCYFAGNTADLNFQIRLYETSNCISFVYGANTYVSNGLQTQIGLRGDSISDFLVLGDTSCNWASAYPYPSINTSFPVGTSCNMPSGFAFHFGSCGSNPGVQLFPISGTVFNDINANGVQDSLEPVIAHHVVNITPGNYYSTTDGSGHYTFFVADSNIVYTLTTGGITYWNSTTSNVLTVNPQTQSCSGNDFGFVINPNVHEVTIHCPSWGAKPGQPEPMPIWYCNNGTATESDTITFVMDSLYSFISANPAPLSVNGSTITWAYSNLAPGQCGSIQLRLLPDSSAVLGDSLFSTLSIGPLNDTIPTNNILAIHQLLSNAWDPNEKVVEPAGKILSGTELNYTIHFQNTGNATAANVIVKDTLDQNLDLMSLSLIGSSHTMNMTLDGQGIATFTFFNIQLPDSGSDFAGSNGYVSFRIKTKSNLSLQTVIDNRAGIIFDSNLPVMTNVASDTIVFDIASGINTLTQINYSAMPNPTTGNIIFKFSENSLETGLLKVYDLTGQLVYEQMNIHSSTVVNLSALKNGLYIASLQTKNGVKTIKFIRN